jgi:hypothetical protein
MNIEDDHANIEIYELLKTSKPGKHLPPFPFPAFVEEPRLCIVTVLKEFIQRTEKLRKSQKLFVTYTKLYNRKCFPGFEVFKSSYISIFAWSSSMFINVKSKLCNVCTLCPVIRANNITNFNDQVLKDQIFTGDK